MGGVVNFRLKYDDKTGKPKGFGFCEYHDAETAASAVRNLNGAEFHGRNLRVSEDGGKSVREPPGTGMIEKIVQNMTREQMVELLAESQKFVTQNPGVQT